MIKNIKIHNILDIIEISKLWNLINVFKKKFNENVHLSVFLIFFKIQWVQENKGMMFLMVPPKDKIALILFLGFRFLLFVVSCIFKLEGHTIIFVLEL
jgi:hypothetical protein